MVVHYIRLALAIAPAFLHLASAEDVYVPEDYCNIDIADSMSFGISTGHSWCTMRIKDGVFVNGIKTWSKPSEVLHPFRGQDDPYGIHLKTGTIMGLEVSYTDGKSTMIGQGEGLWYSEVKWDPKEVNVDWLTGRDLEDGPTFPEAGKVYDDSDAWLNILEVSLSDGQYLCGGGLQDDANPEHTECKKEKPADGRNRIGGTLLGFGGLYGAGGIEGITAYMLKTDAKTTEIHDVEFSPSIEELNARANEDRGLAQQTLMVGHCINNLESGNMTFALGKESTFSKSKSMTNSVAEAWHVGASLGFEYTYGVPTVASASVKLETNFYWEKTTTNTEENSEGSTQTIKWTSTVPVPAGKAVRVTGYVVEGKMDVTWKAQMTLTMENEQKFTVPVHGTMKDTLFSNSYTIVEDEDPKEAMAAVLGGDGDLVDENGQKTDVPPGSKFLARNFIA